MAEVLGIVASGVSVAQIAGQLLACVQQLRTFCRALRDMPGELQGILNELEILGEVFYQLGALKTDSSQPGYSALRASLGHCRTAASKLETIAIAGSRSLQDNKKRAWFLMKAVLKREEVRELKVQLEAAKSLLHLAMTCYSLNMQQKHITLLEVRDTELSEPISDRSRDLPIAHGVTILPQEESKTLQIVLSQRQRSLQSSKCFPRKCYCACHGSLAKTGKFWSLKLPYDWNSCDKTTCRNYKRASIWISLNNIGIPYAILASLDIMWTIHQSIISPSLQITRVVDWQSPAFALLRDIRWNQMEFKKARNEMIQLFDSGAASAMDILPNGKSLPEKLLTLPWPNGDTQLKVLELLVTAGAQLNSAGMLRCCSGWKGLGPWKTGLDYTSAGHMHLMKRLLSLGFDPSEIEVPTSSEWPKECSPIPEGYYDVHDDAFFIDWISEGVKVSPGFAGSSPLQEAILIDSLEAVKRLLVVDQNQDDENVLGQSPLHLAVWRPQHLQFMLQAGFDVNARDWNGRTPLMYAAAAGMTETAISLVRAGADIWIQDNLYRKHRWFHYAVLSSHWQLVLDVIDIIRQSLRFSPNEVQTLLDSTIKLWANETDGVVGIKKSEHFTSLLNWGADPEVRFSAKWLVYKASSNTLLHCITTCTDFNTLLSSGFTSFNYPNSTGCNALMTQLEAGNPELIQKSITSGCNIDQQDNRGRTALHVCAEIIRSTIMSINARDSDFRFQILKCTGVLMCSDANPFLGDCCRCACSTSGCTPSNMLLKDFNQKIRDIPHRSYPLTMHSWVNHWFRLLKKVEKDFEHSRPFFLEIIRLSKFEQLKLTHTCCRFVDHGDRHWITLDEEDVVEILEEEEELSAVLEQEMGALERCSIPELEALWLGETDRLMQIQSENFQDISTSVINLAVDI